MVDLALLQSVSYMAGALGVFIAAIFYVLNLRISQRNMKANTETRQFQLLMQLSAPTFTREGFRTWFEFATMEWKDYDDFEKKYGSDVNPESLVVREFMAGWFNKAVILLRYGMIDGELLYDFLGPDSITLWNKFGEIIRTQRELYSWPEWMRDWEYLYDEMVRIATRRGADTKNRDEFRYNEEMKKRLSLRSA
ncbi:MAG: hypothetical protein NTY03_11880 [Candidatus Bathyarchaeota archaeon]|nr:hypothetical protein [Candidatus Bathyarchaeota archaeon]